MGLKLALLRLDTCNFPMTQLHLAIFCDASSIIKHNMLFSVHLGSSDAFETRTTNTSSYRRLGYYWGRKGKENGKAQK